MANRSTPVPASIATTATTSFIGRERDLTELAEILARERLVTVHGPPGVGKTRFALAYALEHAGRYPGGVSICDLSAASADGLAESLVRGLGGAPDGLGGGDPIAALGTALAARGRCLVVLDELEHLVPSGVGAIATLRSSAPDARILVTSRARLGLSGEVVFSLSPLGFPEDGADPLTSDAVRLFVERARAARRDFDLDVDPGGVVDLVRALDGLPLAIELAASRMRILSPAQLLAAGQRRRDVLSRGAKGSGERGEALWSALDESWALLSPREREVLTQLSVFRGGFTVEAAERVVAVPAEHDGPLVAVIEALVDQSLVTTQPPSAPGAGARFGLLTSVREYVGEHLESSGEAGAARNRHTAFYLELAGLLRGRVDEHGGLAARRALSAELDNLLSVFRRAIASDDAPAALEAALAIDAALSARGPHARRAEILGAALELAARSDAPDALVAEASFARAHARRLQGDVQGALDDCRAAAALAETAGDQRLLGRVLGAIGVTLWERGDLAGAREHVDRALALHEQTKDHDWHAATSNNIGLLALASGNLAEARAAFESALRTHRSVGNRRREAMNLNNLAFVDIERGLPAAAQPSLDEAARIARELADSRTSTTIALTAGLIDLDAGDLPAAEARCRAALETARACGDRFIEAQSLVQLGMTLHAAGRGGEARDAYGLAIARLRETSSRGLEGFAWACLACLEAAEGRLHDARGALASVPNGLGDRGWDRAAELCRASVELRGADAATRARRADEAEAIVREAREHRFATSDRRWSVYARWAVSRLEEALAAALDLRGAAVAAPAPAAQGGAPLVLERRGRWFTPVGGARVTLHRRKPHARILEALLEARVREPGKALTQQTLLARGWPSERCDERSGRNRVYNALATLRKLGLRDMLLSRDDGYLLDPEHAVRIVE